MPRVCTVCTHPERDKIDKALLNREPLRNIAKCFGVSAAAVYRHRQDHLPAALVHAQEALEVVRADSLLAQVQAIMARVNKLFNACNIWLTDPEDPSRYEIGPRAEDIQVVYEEESPTGKIKRKARLSDLLRQVSQAREVTVVEIKHADPRELILKTANTLRATLEIMLKVTEMKDLEVRLEGLEKALEERRGALAGPRFSRLFKE